MESTFTVLAIVLGLILVILMIKFGMATKDMTNEE